MVLDPGEAGRARAVDPAERRAQVRKAAAASVVGTSIEWYDLLFTHISGRLTSSSPHAVAEEAKKPQSTARGCGRAVVLAVRATHSLRSS